MSARRVATPEPSDIQASLRDAAAIALLMQALKVHQLFGHARRGWRYAAISAGIKVPAKFNGRYAAS